MGVKVVLQRRAQRAVSKSYAHRGKPFEAATPFHPPRGRYVTVHYGVMFPDLPAPLNFLNVIAMIGQPRIELFRNEHLITTTAADTANLLIGSAVRFTDQFRGYQVRRDLELAPNSSLLRFGNDFEMAGTYPDFTAQFSSPRVSFDINVRATDKVSHFAKLRGGFYDHWSLLCEYAGTITVDGDTTKAAGLSTLEYARAANIQLPATYFTYHILNIDDQTQVLMVEVRGPRGLPVQQAVYVRSLTDHGSTYERDFYLDIPHFEAGSRRTPNNLSMLLAAVFSWGVSDDTGQPLIEIHGESNGDYVYGMTGGYAGSYRFTGHYQGQPITGTGYLEQIGNR